LLVFHKRKNKNKFLKLVFSPFLELLFFFSSVLPPLKIPSKNLLFWITGIQIFHENPHVNLKIKMILLSFSDQKFSTKTVVEEDCFKLT